MIKNSKKRSKGTIITKNKLNYYEQPIQEGEIRNKNIEAKLLKLNRYNNIR